MKSLTYIFGALLFLIAFATAGCQTKEELSVEIRPYAFRLAEIKRSEVPFLKRSMLPIEVYLQFKNISNTRIALEGLSLRFTLIGGEFRVDPVPIPSPIPIEPGRTITLKVTRILNYAQYGLVPLLEGEKKDFLVDGYAGIRISGAPRWRRVAYNGSSKEMRALQGSDTVHYDLEA